MIASRLGLRILAALALGCGLALSQEEGSGSLPAGSEDVLQYPYQVCRYTCQEYSVSDNNIHPWQDTFSCEGQGYGYYADVDSGCQVRSLEATGGHWRPLEATGGRQC